MLTVSALLIAGALACVAGGRNLFSAAGAGSAAASAE